MLNFFRITLEWHRAGYQIEQNDAKAPRIVLSIHVRMTHKEFWRLVSHGTNPQLTITISDAAGHAKVTEFQFCYISVLVDV